MTEKAAADGAFARTDLLFRLATERARAAPRRACGCSSLRAWTYEKGQALPPAPHRKGSR